MSAIKDLRRDIQRQLHQLIISNESDVLYKLAASIDDEAEEELPGDDATDVELYDFIVDFLKSDQLASQEDQGMSRLLVFNDLITELQQLSEAEEEHRELNTETETQATPSVMNVKADKSPVVTSQVTHLIKLSDVAALLPVEKLRFTVDTFLTQILMLAIPHCVGRLMKGYLRISVRQR